MTLNQVCGIVSQNLNEGGYTPAIASSTTMFDSFIFGVTGVSVSHLELSKGKKLNILLAEGQLLREEERKILLLRIAEKIENDLMVKYLNGYIEDSEDQKYNKVKEIIQSNISLDRPVTESIDELFRKVSLINKSFCDLSIKEKIREIIQVTENLLISNNRRILDEMYDKWGKYSEEVLSDRKVHEFRKKYQCFRHAKDESLDEINKFSERELQFAIEHGLYIINIIKLHVDDSK